MISTDAVPFSVIKYMNDMTTQKLNEFIIDKIEDDLDIQEKISILFLLLNNYTNGFEKIYDLLQRHKKHNNRMLKEFIDANPENWKKKFLEAVCVIQNKQIIRKLGILFHDLELLFSPKNRLCSRYLNPVTKCLYLLCEALTEERIKLLCQDVKNDMVVYEKSLEDTDPLEVHMLYWMQQKYIQIESGKNANLKNLLKHIKRFDDLELLYEDLRKYDNYEGIKYSKDTCGIESINIENMHLLQTHNMKEEASFIQNNAEKDIRKLKSGLCIIINEINFLGKQYENRIGSSADCNKLSNTFKKFGFTVEIFNNLKKDEILEMLANISKNYSTNYDCMFVCILSHGCKGGIISSDEKKIAIDTIEEKICCIELKDMIKIVIVQACQGEVLGKARDDLATDGPIKSSVPNILKYRNFCIFMSTMQGFVSIRHKEQGSWFIQEFCNVLQTGGSELTFLNATRKITQSVIEKRGELNGVDCVAQLPELRTCRLLTDFYFPEYQSLEK